MSTINDRKEGGYNKGVSQSSPKHKIARWEIGWYVSFILGPAIIIAPAVYCCFGLYYAAPDYSFFLILAILGIVLYVVSVFLLFTMWGRAGKPDKQKGPIIRIKGKEYSTWGVLIAASFCLLMLYYLVAVVCLLIEHFAHSEWSWKLFETVCSGKVFWWITCICVFVFAGSWAMREAEIREALFGNNRSDDNNLGVKLFSEGSRQMPLKSFRVFQVLSDGAALAFSSEVAPARSPLDYNGPTVYFFADEKNPYYNDLVITVPDGKTVQHVGTYRYKTKDGSIRTAPIVSFSD